MNNIENKGFTDKLPQVRVTSETKKKIVEIAGEQQRDRGRIVKLSDVIRELIEKGLTTK